MKNLWPSIPLSVETMEMERVEDDEHCRIYEIHYPYSQTNTNDHWSYQSIVSMVDWLELFHSEKQLMYCDDVDECGAVGVAVVEAVLR